MQRFEVIAAFDDEAGVWFVQETDVPGLSTEAPTLDMLRERILAIAPELIALNCGKDAVLEGYAPLSIVAHEQMALAPH